MTALRTLLAENRTPKRSYHGTQRSVPPEETLKRIRPFLRRAGVTRLANITGLDRLGIPVTLAVRPNGRVLSVHSGKGLTLTSALVSAAMEALELHHAEVEWSPPSIRRSYREVSAAHVVPDRDELPLAKAAPFPDDWPYRWVLGWDLVAGEEVALPLSMIQMGDRHDRIFDLNTFQVTSNGLASGNNLPEAVCAALLEVVERDATTCHLERWQRDRPPPLVDTGALAFPTVRELLTGLDAAGLHTAVFDCAVDTGVPVYMACVIDPDERTAGSYTGYGAHPDPEIAMTRAITEAVQAHTVTVAGSRDDMFRHRELTRRSGGDLRLDVLRRGARAGAARPPAVPSPAATFEEEISRLVDGILAAGLRRVVVFDLGTPGFPISVVKVVVPGMEGYRFENYAPGRRALAFSAGEGTP